MSTVTAWPHTCRVEERLFRVAVMAVSGELSPVTLRSTFACLFEGSKGIIEQFFGFSLFRSQSLSARYIPKHWQLLLY